MGLVQQPKLAKKCSKRSEKSANCPSDLIAKS